MRLRVRVRDGWRPPALPYPVERAREREILAQVICRVLLFGGGALGAALWAARE